jgi:hypothetical protein
MTLVKVQLTVVLDVEGVEGNGVGDVARLKLAPALVAGLAEQGVKARVYLDERKHWPRRSVSEFPMPGTKEKA